MLRNSFKIIILALIIGGLTAISCFVFSKGLELATYTRRSFGIMPFLFLPLIGSIVSIVYSRFASDIESGNNLILDEFHHPQKKIHAKIIPFILSSSLLSHIFGASVGREGVAVQMGAGIADQFSFFYKKRNVLLMMGMSAGFAAIFKAPFAATIFGVEVLLVGHLFWESIIPCALSSFCAFKIYQFLLPGIHFTSEIFLPKVVMKSLLWVGFAGVFFGLIARLFVYFTHKVNFFFKNKIKLFYLRPFVGGLILLILFFLIGDDRYHGIGEEMINQSFSGNVHLYDFLGKIFSTAISVGSGFKGGEVTPLFYIGATAGNSLSHFIPLSTSFLAGLGFLSVVAGAMNTPLAAIVLAIEFFGVKFGAYAAFSILMSFLFSGKDGIYSSQKSKIKRFL
jgi:H+/Cl- antiporter ClcA